MKRKLTVVVDERGNVIGTHAPNPNPIEGGIIVQSGLRALPGQVLHEIEFEVPESFHSEQEIVDYHQRIRDHLASRGSK
jgi:hypothetical protein